MYDSEFSFTRDNVLGPEYDATNWWFYGNRIRNAHAWFSFDGLYGGRWYLYDNVGWFDDKPSRECAVNGECKRWQERSPHCAPTCTTAGASSSSGPTAAMRRARSTSSTTAGICGRASSGRASRLHWPLGQRHRLLPARGLSRRPLRVLKPFFNGFLWDSDNYAFNHDLSNHPDFTAGLRAQDYRVSGISVSPSQPLFSDAAHGDFSLVEGSPGRGAGCIIDEDERGLLECRDPLPPVRGPDIGAPAAGAAGPAVDFLFYDGGLYPEPPRIVRADLPRPESTATDEGARLRIVFSTPIRLMASDLRVDFDYGDASSVPYAPTLCQYSGRTLTCPSQRRAADRPAPTCSLCRTPSSARPACWRRPGAACRMQSDWCGNARKAGFCTAVGRARASHFPALRTKSALGACRAAMLR